MGRYILFTAGNELFGLDIAFVDSVDRMGTVTFVPGAPPMVLGLMNLRGSILPVVELKKRSTAGDASWRLGTSRVVVLTEDDVKVAIAVDETRPVVEIPDDPLTPPSAPEDAESVVRYAGAVHWQGESVKLIDPRSIIHANLPCSTSGSGEASN